NFSTPEAPFSRTVVLPQTAAAAALAADVVARELLTPFGRDLDARRTTVATDALPAKTVCVQTFGLARFAAPGRSLLDRAVRRLTMRLLDRWAAADAKRQQSAVQTWVTEQWATQELGPDPLTRRFHQLCEE